MVHVDQLFLDPCYQEKINCIRDELARRKDERVVKAGTYLIRPQQMTAGVSIMCETSVTDPIVVSNDKVTPTIIVRRSSRRKRKPCHLIYYLQI